MADPPSYPGTPRWVKVSGIIGGILVLLFVTMVLTSGGRHGPGRHIPHGDVGGGTPSSGAAMAGVQQPWS